MELNTLERLLLLAILPAEGDYTTLKIVRALREDLSFTEEEHARLKLITDDKQTRWDLSADTYRGYIFGIKAAAIIRDRLEKMNVEKKLTEQHLSIYEKFVEISPV